MSFDPDQPVTDVLELAAEGVPAVVVPSPPGAGKTYLVELVASSCNYILGESVAIACQTAAQSVDVAERIARTYPSLPVYWVSRRGGKNHPRLSGLGVQHSDDFKRLPLESQKCVVVATSAKWSFYGGELPRFDLLIVDEAWQMTDAVFASVAPVAERFVMVGDPGQIAPVVKSDVQKWQGLPDAPHMPAPVALMNRWGPEVVRQVRLRVTRRLGPDTASIVQPVFYPDHEFESVRAPHRLVPGAAVDKRWEEMFAAAAAGTEVLLVEVPGRSTVVADPEVARAIADCVRQAVLCGVDAGGEVRPLAPGDVGVVCPHVNQVGLVRTELGADLADRVMVDTTERWQGLEKPVMIVWHPLSGRSEVTDFARDAGRMCVMLSRHTTACFLFAREGVDSLLATAGTSGERLFVNDGDPAWTGVRAHILLADLLRGRAFPLGAVNDHDN